MTASKADRPTRGRVTCLRWNLWDAVNGNSKWKLRTNFVKPRKRNNEMWNMSWNILQTTPPIIWVATYLDSIKLNGILEEQYYLCQKPEQLQKILLFGIFVNIFFQRKINSSPERMEVSSIIRSPHINKPHRQKQQIFHILFMEIVITITHVHMSISMCNPNPAINIKSNLKYK